MVVSPTHWRVYALTVKSANTHFVVIYIQAVIQVIMIYWIF